MRIRELYFNNFRSFRGERIISFVDPLSNMVRPLTVLAGSNGSGKTTIFNAIEALLTYMLNPNQTSDFMREAWKTGLIRLTLEVSPRELAEAGTIPPDGQSPVFLNIAIGQSNLVPNKSVEKWENLTCHLVPRGGGGNHYKRKSPLVEYYRKKIMEMLEGWQELQGGLLSFPCERQIQLMKGGAVAPPSGGRQWIFHFSSNDAWKGSLEELWVWQNYLDLENDKKRQSLAPFVNQVEEVLGEGRSIVIKEGRALVSAGWASGQKEAPYVNLSQLPSGEQNVLLLFGELARQSRKGAVILVDEVENSLHPTLQRLTMWNLNRLTREWDAQVIVTTHSIEVINTVRGGAFINLDYPPEKESDFPHSLEENEVSV